MCLGIRTGRNFTGWQKSEMRKSSEIMYTVNYVLKMDVACVYYCRT